MTIPYFHITAIYLLWIYLLLCLGGKMALDYRRQKKAAQQEEAVNNFFRPYTGSIQSEEFQTVRRCCKNSELFALACTRYAEVCDSLDHADYARLYTCLMCLFHDQLHSSDMNSPLFRCMLLERMALCQIHSPKLDAFLDSCQDHSELERLWCERCRETCAVK